MSRICTLEGPFNYTISDNAAKLSAMFDVNDALGQMVYGGRWPLVKRAACKIATDAIDSPFMFQIRNFDAPEAVEMDPVLARIWGPNDEAGAAILGRPCWNTLKGCLGAEKKTLANVIKSDELEKSRVKSVMNFIDKLKDLNLSSKELTELYFNISYLANYMDFDKVFDRIKRQNPAMNDDEVAVNAFFGILAENPRPTLTADKEKDLSGIAWDYVRAALIRLMEIRGYWTAINNAARNRAGAIGSQAGAATATTEPSLQYYAMDTAKYNEQDAEAAAQRAIDAAAVEIAAEESAAFDYSKLLIPALGLGALLLLG